MVKCKLNNNKKKYVLIQEVDSTFEKCKLEFSKNYNNSNFNFILNKFTIKIKDVANRLSRKADSIKIDQEYFILYKNWRNEIFYNL